MGATTWQYLDATKKRQRPLFLNGVRPTAALALAPDWIAYSDAPPTVADRDLYATRSAPAAPPSSNGSLACPIAAGAQEDSFDYQMNVFEHDGLPYVIEVAFAYAPADSDRAIGIGDADKGRLLTDEGLDRVDALHLDLRSTMQISTRAMVAISFLSLICVVLFDEIFLV
jgi:hypothetical protein